MVPDAPVGREQHFEAGFLGGVQQCAVAQRVPALGLRRVDRVCGQRLGQSLRRPVVKEDGPPAGMDSARRLSYEIEYGCDQLAGHVEWLRASE